MNKLIGVIVFLATVNVCSAMVVVYLKHLSRLKNIELSEYQASIDDLDVQWSQLQIEESTFSEHGLIERAAAEKLDMVFPRLSETVMIER